MTRHARKFATKAKEIALSVLRSKSGVKIALALLVCLLTALGISTGYAPDILNVLLTIVTLS